MKDCQFYSNGDAALTLQHAEMERLVTILHQHKATLNNAINDPKITEAHRFVLQDDAAFTQTLIRTIMDSRATSASRTASKQADAGPAPSKNP